MGKHTKWHASPRLLKAIQHLALHSVLHITAPNHRVNDLKDGTLRIFLTSKILKFEINWMCVVWGCTSLCLKLTAMIFCSETCEPIAKRRFSCFSMRFSISWSSSVVKPSAPAKLPVIAASKVDTWNRRSASVTCESVAKGCSCILASDSDIRMTASNWLRKN